MIHVVFAANCTDDKVLLLMSNIFFPHESNNGQEIAIIKKNYMKFDI